MFNYELNLSTISAESTKKMICFHGYGANYHIIDDLKKLDLIDASLIGFNFPDHDLQKRTYKPNELTFGTINELLPALYVLKKNIIDDCMETIDLYGRSAGGGALINLIAILNSTKFNDELQKLDIGSKEKRQMLAAIQQGLIILDVPLKSVEEIIDFRGGNTELEVLANNYRENQLRPIDNLELLKGLSLKIILHFQTVDEIISNRDDNIYIEKLNNANQSGITSVVIGNDGGHETLHQSLWTFYDEQSLPLHINKP